MAFESFTFPLCAGYTYNENDIALQSDTISEYRLHNSLPTGTCYCYVNLLISRLEDSNTPKKRSPCIVYRNDGTAYTINHRTFCLPFLLRPTLALCLVRA